MENLNRTGKTEKAYVFVYLIPKRESPSRPLGGAIKSGQVSLALHPDRSSLVVVSWM